MRCQALEAEAKGAQTAIKSMEAELALAQHKVLEAEAQAEEAKRRRAEVGARSCPCLSAGSMAARSCAWESE